MTAERLIEKLKRTEINLELVIVTTNVARTVLEINIPAADLKRIVKKLSPVNSDITTINSDSGILYAMDADIGVSVSSSIFRNSGLLSVSSQLFKSTVSKLTKDVKLEQTGKGPLNIQSAKFKASIPIAQDSLPFPIEGGKSFSLSSEKLNSLLSFVSTVTTEKNNFDHTGSILIKGDGKNLTTVATDNHRIAFSEYPLGVEIPSTIIPSKAVKAIKDFTDNILISETPSVLFLKSNDVLVFARKTNVKFPDVYSVIPKQYVLEVKLDSNSFKDAIERVSPTVDPDTPAPRVRLDFGDTLKISTGNDTIGKADDELDIEHITKPINISLTANLKYISEFLNTVSGCVIIKLGGTGKPFMLEAGNRRLLTAGLKV